MSDPDAGWPAFRSFWFVGESGEGLVPRDTNSNSRKLELTYGRGTWWAARSEQSISSIERERQRQDFEVLVEGMQGREN